MAPGKRRESAPKLRLRKSTARAPKSPASIHELEISLCEIEPRIWRRFAVRSNTTLAKLHDVVQVVMSWMDSHLHQFETNEEKCYAPLSPYGDPDWDERVSNSAKARLQDVMPAKGARLIYQYDFGDGWEHVIEVVAVHPPEPGARYPRCLAGERACPPEDCGGPHSYPEFLAALADPRHPEHEELTEWIGGKFDADAFDVGEVNKLLAEFR